MEKEMFKKAEYKAEKGVMGHASAPMHIDALQAQKSDLGKMKKLPMDYRGTPAQAFDRK